MDKLLTDEQMSPEPTWPDDLMSTNNDLLIKGITLRQCHAVKVSEKQTNLRECADTLGRVSYVPHFDVSGGDSEDKTRRVPETQTKTRKTDKINNQKIPKFCY